MQESTDPHRGVDSSVICKSAPANTLYVRMCLKPTHACVSIIYYSFLIQSEIERIKSGKVTEKRRDGETAAERERGRIKSGEVTEREDEDKQ